MKKIYVVAYKLPYEGGGLEGRVFYTSKKKANKACKKLRDKKEVGNDVMYSVKELTKAKKKKRKKKK